jgi:hypothetical protein
MNATIWSSLGPVGACGVDHNPRRGGKLWGALGVALGGESGSEGMTGEVAVEASSKSPATDHVGYVRWRRNQASAENLGA